MNVKNRYTHMLFFSSMIVLTITGFMVYMPRSWIEILGSSARVVFEYRTLIHRIAAIVFILSAMHHLIYIIKTSEGRWRFKQLLPRWHDFIGPFIYILEVIGLRKPTPERFFAYHERLEYWLNFLGTVTVIITGTILWLEDYFGNFELDISLVLHFYAAILALLGMVVWNLTNLHPEFYFYRKEEELPCSRDECIQCDACVKYKLHRPKASTHCFGDNHQRALNFLKRGITACAQAKELINDGTCPHSCMELAFCASVCLYGARVQNEDGLLSLNHENCVGCGMCARECPTRVIALVPRLFRIQIMCNSQHPKYTASLNCKTQCRRCMICVKVCSQDAISFNGHLTEIDYRKCISCGMCASKCPVEVILDELFNERTAAQIGEKCVGCGNCRRVCPVDAISGGPKDQHVVDPQKCISCSFCTRYCKKSAIKLDWYDELTRLQEEYSHEG